MARDSTWRCNTGDGIRRVLSRILNETLRLWDLAGSEFSYYRHYGYFAIGSSWGTFAIMLPFSHSVGDDARPCRSRCLLPLLWPVEFLVITRHPLATQPLLRHLASGSDHIDHVRTQLPYALLAALFATIGYLVAGWLVAI